MFKLNTYYERDKLPTIYSPNQNIKYKSISNKKNTNYQNIFDHTFSNGVNDYYKHKSNINKLKNLLKNVDSKDKLNVVHNKIITIYDKNRNKTRYGNSMNSMAEKMRTSSYNQVRNKTTNKILNESYIPFNESYHNFLNDLKKKKASFKINQLKEISKDIDNNKLKPLILTKKFNFEQNNNNSNNDNSKIISKFSPNKTLTNNKKLTNNLKLLTKKKEDSFGERLKKFFTPNITNSINNKFNIKNSDKNNKNINKKKCNLCHKYIDIYRFNTHYNSHPSKIFNWLYLGSYQNACNSKDLKDLKISYILNCAVECQNKNFPDITYFQAKIHDLPNFNISIFFQKTNNFINKAKISGKNILIHCQLGISRSTTCLIAYMIKFMGYSTASAIQFIKNKRPHIMPNFGFLQQLKNYEEKIKFEKNDDLDDNSNKNNNGVNNNSNTNDFKFNKTELRFNGFVKNFPF